MIIEKCKSIYGRCPCLDCRKLTKCGTCTNGDTERLCAKARAYCEKVNSEEEVPWKKKSLKEKN